MDWKYFSVKSAERLECVSFLKILQKFKFGVHCTCVLVSFFNEKLFVIYATTDGS